MSRLGTFIDKTFTKDTVLDLKDCGDVYIENNGSVEVKFSKKRIAPGQNYKPDYTAIFDGDIDLKFNDVIIGNKEVYISYFKYIRYTN